MAGVVEVDVGGTLTDLFYSRDGMSVDRVLKVPSTPDDPARGVIDALNTADIAPHGLGLILHSKIERIPFGAGDGIRLASPGGGFGDPLERDPAAVEHDLNAGLIGRDVAETIYSVVIAEAHHTGDRLRYTLDHDATEARRAALQGGRA